MMTVRDDDWAKLAKALLKSELKKRDVSYKELAARLTAMGHEDNERNIANKISRGGFTASYLLLCLRAIGCESVDLRHLPQYGQS